MKKKDFELVLARLEILNDLRINNDKMPLTRFWTGCVHRLLTSPKNVGEGSLDQYWLPGFFKTDEALEAVIDMLIEVEQGKYK